MADDVQTNGTEPARADDQSDEEDERPTLADASHTPPNDADSATDVWARGDEALGPTDD
jgi:hypothetical protein